ncbi:MAG: amino acid transporter [Planctomycetes bacterium]|nr:amino acid transporter [Planctomycetota bacterium]
MATLPPPKLPSDSSPGSKKPAEEYFWLWVVCLLGLDYFSTLAYQPSITYHETKLLGPIATAVVVLVTLFGALPIYCHLAARSPAGAGAFGIVEKLVRGWRGKTLVLILLGFAATDFTMLKSMSLADASVHVLNKHDGDRQQIARAFAGWCKDCAKDYLSDEAATHINEQLVVTIILGVIAFAFWFLLRRGFTRKVTAVAVPLVALYLLLTGILIVGGLFFLGNHGDIFTHWLDEVVRGGIGGWSTLVLFALIALPKLALGLSGFEMSMILMPQVQGVAGEQPPVTRIRNTRKVLVAAALIMSVYLLGSVTVTTLLIPPPAFGPEGLANNRALAYLAHGGPLVAGDQATLLPFCGPGFGAVYDLVVILMLALAGTSVITALSVLLPSFLMRFGMEFSWAQRWGVMLILFAGVNVLITVMFQADVEDQRGAYATGVLVLMASAAVVTLIQKRRERGSSFFRALNVGYFGAIAVVFLATTLAVVMQAPGGLAIAMCFVAAILTTSILSRAWRADELRTIGFEFKDEQSKFHWDNLRHAYFPVLIPVDLKRENHEEKEAQIRAQHHLSPEVGVAFLEVYVDDPSEFLQNLMIEVVRDNHRYVIKVTHCVSLAHAIAAVALEMSLHSEPPGLHFGWPEKDMLSASWSYLAFGEGNLPWKVRELIHRAEKDPNNRPRVIVG